MLVTLHGYDINIRREWWENGKGGHYRRQYPKQLLEMANAANVRFVAVSEAIRRRAIEYGIPAKKVAVRYIGVDTAKFSPGSVPFPLRPCRVLFVGRLVEKKGTEYLIRAFAAVSQRVCAAELVIVGDGPLRLSLEALSESLELNVRFLGTLSSERIRQEMQGARVFCLPSVRARNGDAEGFGLALLEAQSCGLPVVTSASGGSTEGLLEAQTGFAFPEKDEYVLADLLTKMLQDERLCGELSINSVAFVRERFDLYSCTAAIEREYDYSMDGTAV
jgi:glycosyltransferase involved in cell wall biosynthesis